MTLATVLTFLAVAALAYVTPGPDWFVIMRNAAVSRRSGLVSALGVQCGLVVHITAAALGVAAVLLASAEAFTVLKIVGASYLVWLGVRSLLDARRAARAPDDDSPVAEPPRPDGRVFRQSMLANVLNPKAALFFVAVLPQFISADAALAPQVLVLGVLDIALGFAWWTAFVLVVRRVQAVVGGRRSRVVLDRVSGVALVGLGGALAFTGHSRV